MPYNPDLIYALPWCEGSYCGVDLIWLGNNLASGVKLEMRGKSQTIYFDDTTYTHNESRAGLANEVLLEWKDGACDINASNYSDIETVALIDSQGKLVGDPFAVRFMNRDGE